MKRKLPPLNALRAFETVARTLSFSKAAEEMGVTRDAVIKQIKTLENYFEKVLLEKNNNNLTLTSNAKNYYLKVTQALDLINNCTDELRKNDQESLTIHSPTAFAINFLIPRINNFKNKYPHLDVYIDSGLGEEIDVEKMNHDIIIWDYRNSFKNFYHEKLIDNKILLVCSPKLLEQPVKEFEDLIKYGFLRNEYRPENVYDWAESVLIDKKLIKINLRFNYVSLLIEAAKNGLGIGFIPQILVNDLLQNGQLVNPLNISHQDISKYWLVYPQKNIPRKNIIIFSKWLKEELQKINCEI